MHRTIATVLLATALAVTAAAPAAAAPAIPDAALLQAADLHGVTPSPVTDDSWAALRPPRPCDAGAYPSDGLRRADRAISALIGIGERPTVVLSEVATYRSNGARRYFQELRAALRTCSGTDEAGVSWARVAGGTAGDESLLLRRTEHIEFAGTDKDTYVAVARTGRVLVVVADTGWETGDGHESLVRELVAAAVNRAAVLDRRT